MCSSDLLPVLFQQVQLLAGGRLAAAAEAAAVQVVGIHLQRVEQSQQHALLGRADAVFVVADCRKRDTQPLRQLCAGQPSSSRRLRSCSQKLIGFLLAGFRQILTLSYSEILSLSIHYNKKLEILGLT